MEALILSDSHGKADRIKEALERQIRRPDLLIYLGDGLRDLSVIEAFGIPFYAVRGNCDLYVEHLGFSCSDECLIAIGGDHLALLTHGAAYGVKGGLGALLQSAARQGADLVFFGHTHIPHLEVIPKGTVVGGVQLARPLYVFNPGSIGREGSFGTLTCRAGSLLLAHGSL